MRDRRRGRCTDEAQGGKDKLHEAPYAPFRCDLGLLHMLLLAAVHGLLFFCVYEVCLSVVRLPTLVHGLTVVDGGYLTLVPFRNQGVRTQGKVGRVPQHAGYLSFCQLLPAVLCEKTSTKCTSSKQQPQPEQPPQSPAPPFSACAFLSPLSPLLLLSALHASSRA